MHHKRLFLLLLVVLLGLTVHPSAAQESPDVRRIAVPGLMLGARLSPDGHTLAVFEISAVHNDYEVELPYLPIRLIELETGDTRALAGQTDYAADIAFSPDGTVLASYHGGGTISLWDVASGEEIKRLPALVGLSRIVFLGDGKTLAVAMPGLPLTIALWDTESGAITQILSRRFITFAQFNYLVQDPNVPGSLQFDRLSAFAAVPDGSALITVNLTDEVLYWDLSSGEFRTLAESEGGQPQFSIRRLMVTDDDSTLIYFHRHDQMIYFVDVASGTQSAAVPANTTQEPAVSSDGQKLVWIEEDTGNLIVWSADQPDSPVTVTLPDPTAVLENFRAPQGGLMLTPDGKTAVLSGFTALGGDDNEIWVVPLPE